MWAPFLGVAFFGGAFLGAFVCGAPFLEAAPGYRDHADGVQRSVGNLGYSWSSATSSIGGLHLGFHVTWLNFRGQGHRGYGFQLRCLSE